MTTKRFIDTKKIEWGYNHQTTVAKYELSKILKEKIRKEIKEMLVKNKKEITTKQKQYTKIFKARLEKSMKKDDNKLLDHNLANVAINTGDCYRYLFYEDIPDKLVQEFIANLKNHLLNNGFLIKNGEPSRTPKERIRREVRQVLTDEELFNAQLDKSMAVTEEVEWGYQYQADIPKDILNKALGREEVKQMLTDEKLGEMKQETEDIPEKARNNDFWREKRTRAEIRDRLLDHNLTCLAIHLGEYYQYLLREDVPNELAHSLVEDLQYHLLDKDFLTK